MLRSLYSAVSGLQQHQVGMDVVGNNISNVNTVGYKSGRISFQDMMSQTLASGRAPTGNIGGINPKQIGLGANVASVSNVFEQGTSQTTGVITDLMIEGKGFFVVRGETESEKYYTRAGSFSFDKTGMMVSPEGYVVQGWMADVQTGTILTDTEVTDIQIGAGQSTIPARTTTNSILAGNLDTRSDATIVQYQSLLTQAKQTTALSSIYSSSGAKLDLLDGEPIRIKADATEITDMSAVYNSSDVALGLDTNQTLKMTVTEAGVSRTITLSYSATGDGTVDFVTDPTNPTGTFKDLGDLRSALNSILDQYGTDYDVTLTNGKLTVKKNAGGDPLTVSFTGNPNLTATLQPIVGNYTDVNNQKTSSSFIFEKVISTGTDFTSMSELAGLIENAIGSNVSDGFKTTYYDAANQNTAPTGISTLDVAGKFVYYNAYQDPTATAFATFDITGFSIDKAYSGTVFEKNILTSSTISKDTDADDTNDSGGYSFSQVFLTNASLDDALVNLYSSSGQKLGLTDGAIIQADALIGDEIPNGNNINTLPVSAGDPGTDNIFNTNDSDGTELEYTSVQDLLDMLAGYLGYPADKVLLEDGKIKVTGEKGVKNEIDFISLQATGTASYQSFNEYMKYQTLQNASGGQLVTSQTIYDSQGNSHKVNYEFYLADEVNNEWNLIITPADETSDAITIEGVSGNEVRVKFNQDGSYQGVFDLATGQIIPALKCTLSSNNGAETIQGLEVNLGTPGLYDGMVLSAATSTITLNDQDGYPKGDLEKLSINDVGEIVGSYTNGEIKVLAQIALASFQNQEGLVKVGSTLFSETPNSGAAAIGKAGAGGRGTILSGALENSNVDLAQEFVTMITTQRGYQANSRVITTSDEMLQELMTLKR